MNNGENVLQPEMLRLPEAGSLALCTALAAQRKVQLSGKGMLKLQKLQTSNAWSDACALLCSLCSMYTEVVDIVRTIRPALPELRPLMDESLATTGAAIEVAVPGSLCFERWPRVPEDAIWQELGSSDFEAEAKSWREVCEALQPHAELARLLLAHVQACSALGFYGGLAPPHSKAGLRRTRQLARRVAAMRAAAAAAARPAPGEAEERARRRVAAVTRPRSSPVLTRHRRVSLRLGALSLEHCTRIEITPARLPLDAGVPMPVLVSGPTALIHRLAACDVRWYDPQADGVPALLSALRPLELSAEQRRLTRVPPSARHMAYLHPLTQREPVTALRDAAASTGHLLAADALLAGRASDGFALCGAVLYFDHAGRLLASGACALSPGGDAQLRGPFPLSAAAQAALAERQRWQPPAFEVLAEAGARSTAWLHPSEFGDALGARGAPYGGFAFTDGEGGEGSGVYFCLEPPLGSARLCLEGAAPPHRAPTLREVFALPPLGSTNLLGPLGAAAEAEARAAQGDDAGGDAGGAQERPPG